MGEKKRTKEEKREEELKKINDEQYSPWQYERCKICGNWAGDMVVRESGHVLYVCKNDECQEFARRISLDEIEDHRDRKQTKEEGMGASRASGLKDENTWYRLIRIIKEVARRHPYVTAKYIMDAAKSLEKTDVCPECEHTKTNMHILGPVLRECVTVGILEPTALLMETLEGQKQNIWKSAVYEGHSIGLPVGGSLWKRIYSEGNEDDEE